MEEKELDRGGIIGSIVGLFLLVTAVIVQSVSASNNNCVNIDCLKEKLERIYSKCFVYNIRMPQTSNANQLLK